MELDPELHRLRAVKQRQVDEAREIIDSSEAPQHESLDVEKIQADAISHQEPNWWSQLTHGSLLLSKGLGYGCLSGATIGALYSLKTRHSRPLWVISAAGLNFALLGGLFVAFRELLPHGLERLYWRTIASEEEKQLRIPISITWNLPGLELPAFIRNMSDENYEYAKSSIAGGMAGYTMTRLRATENAMLTKSSIGHVHTSGIRGGLVWALIAFSGHWLYSSLNNWRESAVVRRAVSERKQKIQSSSETLHNNEDEDEDDIDFNLINWLDRRGIDILKLFPNVHSKEEFEYREYLEAKVRLLETEIDAQEKLRRRRLRLLNETKHE